MLPSNGVLIPVDIFSFLCTYFQNKVGLFLHASPIVLSYFSLACLTILLHSFRNSVRVAFSQCCLYSQKKSAFHLSGLYDFFCEPFRFCNMISGMKLSFILVMIPLKHNQQSATLFLHNLFSL